MTKLTKVHKILIIVGCCVLVLLGGFLFCWNFRYYTAEEVRTYYAQYHLYMPHHKDSNAPVEAVIALHRSSSFKKAEGMTPDEVHKKWGMPHAESGSGLYMEDYFTADGCIVTLTYFSDANDVVSVGRVWVRKL